MGLDGWAEWLLAAHRPGPDRCATAGPHARQPAPAPRARPTGRGADRDLEHLSERHQRILESVGEGIFGVDRELRISFVNPAAAQLLGWEADDLLGRDACRTLCTEEHDECLVSMVMALGEAVTQSARSYRRQDGSEFAVEVTASPKAGPGGVDGAVVVFRDITERAGPRRDEATVRQRGQPRAAYAAHRDPRITGDARRRRHRASSPTRPSTSSTSRPAAPNDSPAWSTTSSTSSGSRPAASTSARGPRTSPRSSRRGGLAPVAGRGAAGAHRDRRRRTGSALCDADRIVQALVNLLGNALKFTQPGGPSRQRHARASTRSCSRCSDEGRGIPEDEFETIFERFHQVQQADGRKLGGTGLGLPITKAIVERHGGGSGWRASWAWARRSASRCRCSDSDPLGAGLDDVRTWHDLERDQHTPPRRSTCATSRLLRRVARPDGPGVRPAARRRGTRPRRAHVGRAT